MCRRMGSEKLAATPSHGSLLHFDLEVDFCGRESKFQPTGHNCAPVAPFFLMTKSHHQKCSTICMQFEGSDERKNEWKKAQLDDLLQALKVQIASCLRPESMVQTRVGLVNIFHLLGALFCSMQTGQEKSAWPRSHTHILKD